mmetsp:Transcript_37237/g.112418  ORF Transcript_37237/g.112418 Transcript_37237/m.112418 type:complete len:95 (-) Transcript_37237:223-507(-)
MGSALNCAVEYCQPQPSQRRFLDNGPAYPHIQYFCTLGFLVATETVEPAVLPASEGAELACAATPGARFPPSCTPASWPEPAAAAADSRPAPAS